MEVSRVERGRQNFDLDLIVGWNRFVYVFKLKNIGRPVFRIDNRFHIGILSKGSAALQWPKSDSLHPIYQPGVSNTSQAGPPGEALDLLTRLVKRRGSHADCQEKPYKSTEIA
jgi:hypothetical protein